MELRAFERDLRDTITLYPLQGALAPAKLNFNHMSDTPSRTRILGLCSLGFSGILLTVWSTVSE